MSLTYIGYFIIHLHIFNNVDILGNKKATSRQLDYVFLYIIFFEFVLLHPLSIDNDSHNRFL